MWIGETLRNTPSRAEYNAFLSLSRCFGRNASYCSSRLGWLFPANRYARIEQYLKEIWYGFFCGKFPPRDSYGFSKKSIGGTEDPPYSRWDSGISELASSHTENEGKIPESRRERVSYSICGEPEGILCFFPGRIGAAFSRTVLPSSVFGVYAIAAKHHHYWFSSSLGVSLRAV
jgi:hypothetical protein